MKNKPSTKSRSNNLKKQELKNEIKFILKLADIYWREFDTRRQFEWKVNFALWASLAAVIGFSIKENVSMSNWIWIGFFIIGIVYAFIWSQGLYSKNALDQKYANELWQIAQIKMKTNLTLQKTPKNQRNVAFLNWSHGSQIIITLFLLFLAALILTGNFIRKNDDPSKQECKRTRIECGSINY